MGTSGSLSDIRESERWTLDSLGNWRSHSYDGDGAGSGPSRIDTREVNEANEITDFTGTRGPYALIEPVYDAAGNIIFTGRTGNETAPVSYELFDAWNRQVWTDGYDSLHQTDAGDVRSGYDGLGRMISKFVDGAQDSTNNVGTTEEYYYNESQQVLEVRNGSITPVNGVPTASINAVPKEIDLWDASYVNAPAVVQMDDNSDGTIDARLNPTWDGNHNVVGLVADHGKTVQRFGYHAYGEGFGVFNGDSNAAGTGMDENYDWFFDWSGPDYTNFKPGFQGMRWDEDAGQYLSQTRRYLPSLGTWNSRDPLGTAYQDGLSLYQFIRSNPVMLIDPSGTQSTGVTGTFNDPMVSIYVGNSDPNLVVDLAYISTVQGILTGKPADLKSDLAGSAAYKKSLQRFRVLYERSMNNMARSLDCDSGLFEYAFRAHAGADFTNTPGLFAIGNTTLQGVGKVLLQIECECVNGKMTPVRWKGVAYVQIYLDDAFTDPFDVFDMLPGNVNIGGVPYKIQDKVGFEIFTSRGNF